MSGSLQSICNVQVVWGSSSSVHSDLAWEPEGQSPYRPSMECELVAGAVPHGLVIAKVPLNFNLGINKVCLLLLLSFMLEERWGLIL